MLNLILVSSICKMADVVYGILYSNVHPVSGESFQEAEARDEESFLREVVTPIYQVLLMVITSFI